MKKVFLDELPLRDSERAKKIKRIINWKKSIGFKVKFIYENIEGEVEIVDYKDRYLSIKYLDKEPFKIYSSHFEKCCLAGLLGKYTNKFKYKIGEIFEDLKRDITITDRKYYKNEKDGIVYKVYKYKCNKCGFECGEHYKNGEYKEELWIVESSLLRGQGCACCGKTKIVVPGINDIPTTALWMVKYFQNPDEAKLYPKTSSQKIYPICLDCGRIKNKSMMIKEIYQNHSIGCGCSDGQSYPFKMMFNILEQLDIDFETEYSPDWIKPKRYDFYFAINKNKYIIEMDGALGHGNKVHSRDTKTIEETLEIDNYKDRLASEHDIEVIRINCIKSELDYIKSNILLKLNDLFDLDNIDWNKVEEFALSNLVKKACELKRDNPDMSTTEIGKMMNLEGQTIRKYLIKGNKLGWCNYDPKEERKKSAIKNNSKPVEIFKDGISLGKFESIAELEKQSEEKFGTKLFQTYISSVCLGKRTQYKGYTFKY